MSCQPVESSDECLNGNARVAIRLPGRREHLGIGASQLVLRVLLALAGGYASTAAAVLLLGVSFTALGLARSEAVVLASMLGFVIYLGVLLWAFAEPRLARLAGALLAGSALYGVLLWRWWP
jgi:hypothetical protein